MPSDVLKHSKISSAGASIMALTTSVSPRAGRVVGSALNADAVKITNPANTTNREYMTLLLLYGHGIEFNSITRRPASTAPQHFLPDRPATQNDPCREL